MYRFDVNKTMDPVQSFCPSSPPIPLPNQITKVFIWGSHGQHKGHASLSISDGTYISWQGIETNELPTPQDVTFAHDTSSEGIVPDHVYVISGLCEDTIVNWLNDIETKTTHLSTPQDYIITVKNALKDGGAWDKLTQVQQQDFDTISMWTPNYMNELCQVIGSPWPMQA